MYDFFFHKIIVNNLNARNFFVKIKCPFNLFEYIFDIKQHNTKKIQ